MSDETERLSDETLASIRDQWLDLVVASPIEIAVHARMFVPLLFLHIDALRAELARLRQVLTESQGREAALREAIAVLEPHVMFADATDWALVEAALATPEPPIVARLAAGTRVYQAALAKWEMDASREDGGEWDIAIDTEFIDAIEAYTAIDKADEPDGGGS